LEKGKVFLSSSATDTPELDAQILLSHTLGISHMTLLADPPDTITSSDEKTFLGLLNRRAAGEPVAYLTGYKDFYKHSFLVDRSTLIPRPETEILVEEILRRFTGTQTVRLLDIGTGCGCIALSLAAERPGWDITATDISQEALALAIENGKRLSLNNVEFLHSNLFENVKGKFDAIVSNPPYVDINEKQNLQIELREYEPETALFTTGSGLKVIEELVCKAPPYLNSGGVLLCEIGYDQRDRVESLFDKNISQGSHPWSQISFHPDLAGHMRVVSAEFKGL
jgi:release factor glutamine methyltransferase